MYILKLPNLAHVEPPPPPKPEEKPSTAEPMETDPEPEPKVDPAIKKVRTLSACKESSVRLPEASEFCSYLAQWASEVF